MGGGLTILLYIVIALLVVLIFKGPLARYWNRLRGEFEDEQALQAKAAHTKHGHFYLTIQKYEMETPEAEKFTGPDGTTLWRFDGNKFTSEEAADFARYTSILAKARAYYSDIDVWTQSLPGPHRFRGRR